jgi:predicted nucleic acid-binding protein
LTLLDTGPLVALLKRDEQHHPWALETFATLDGRLLTCEAVLTEAFFLLKRWPDVVASVLERVERGSLEVEPLADDAASVRTLMQKYASVPMSFADACLVRLSERHGQARLMTLDSDFAVYRKKGRHLVPLIAPWSVARGSLR